MLFVKNLKEAGIRRLAGVPQPTRAQLALAKKVRARFREVGVKISDSDGFVGGTAEMVCTIFDGCHQDVEKTSETVLELCGYQHEVTMFFIRTSLAVLSAANPWARYNIAMFQADPAKALQFAGPGIGIFVAAATDQPHPLLSDPPLVGVATHA